MLRAEGVVVGYPGGSAVLTGANLSAASGRRVALLGANGSGKTTLLQCLAGALPAADGRVTLDGQPLAHTRAALRAHRRRVQLVLQDPDDQLFSADVTQDVSFGPLNLGLCDDDARARTDEALALLGIAHLAARPTHQLSFGERKRVALAGAVAMRPDVLLLDEPTAGLDPDRSASFIRLIRALHRELGLTVVLVTHDLDTLVQMATSVAVLAERRIVSHASLDETLAADHPFVARFFRGLQARHGQSHGAGAG